CGSTGSSTAPHLHFAMKKDGVFIDPESLNLDGLRVLPKAFRVEFDEVRSKYDPVLDQVPLPEPLVAEVEPPTAVSADNVESADATPGASAENGMMQDDPPAGAAANVS